MNHPRYNYLYTMSKIQDRDNTPQNNTPQKSENDKRRMFDNTINSVINENIQNQIIHDNKTQTKNNESRFDNNKENTVTESYITTPIPYSPIVPSINFEVNIQTIIIVMLILFCFMFYIICKMNSKINQLYEVIVNQHK